VSAAVEPSSVELGALLRRLHALCEDTRDLAQIDALRSRLKHGQLRVLVAGEAKRGKSTLINALLGRDVLPRGALPVTALATELLQGTPEGVHVQYRDGRRDRVPIRELRAFVAESQNPRNTKRVDRVTVQLDLGMPHPMLTLIDTPGVGSVLAHNTVEATSAYESMDAVVFVLTGDAPLSANELQLLRQVSSLAVRSYVVLNKADLIATRELDDVMRFLAERVTTATGDRTSILACSATAALEARLSGDQDAWLASGVHTLHEELVLGVAVHRQDDVRRSVVAAARRLAAAALDEATTVRATLDASAHHREDLTSTLAATLQETESRRDEALHVLSSQTRSRLADLAADAQRCQSPTVRLACSELKKLADTSMNAPAPDFEAQGRRTIEHTVRSRVEVWHSGWYEHLAGDLLHQVARQQELLRQDADRLADAARDLLGVDLSSGPIHMEPIPLPQLRLDFAADIGWNSSLVSAFRVRGTARSARRRILRYLRGECARLVDKSVGRGRANLQSTRQEATARVRAAVDESFTAQAVALHRAYDAAAGLVDRTDEEQAATRRSLEERATSLQEVIQSLDLIAATPPADPAKAPAAPGTR